MHVHTHTHTHTYNECDKQNTHIHTYHMHPIHPPFIHMAKSNDNEASVIIVKM